MRYNDGVNTERGGVPCRKIFVCVRLTPPVCPRRLSLRLRCAILRIAFFTCIFSLRRQQARKGALNGRGNDRSFSKSDFLCGKSPFVLENVLRLRLGKKKCRRVQQMDELQQARVEIDAVDQEMARLFERRMAACRQVAQYKREQRSSHSGCKPGGGGDRTRCAAGGGSRPAGILHLLSSGRDEDLPFLPEPSQRGHEGDLRGRGRRVRLYCPPSGPSPKRS